MATEHLSHEEYMKRMAEGPQPDMVNSPPHYTQGGIECIDAIEAALGPEGFEAFCRGNIIKYTWRSPGKNGQQDLEKARWYLNRIIRGAT